MIISAKSTRNILCDEIYAPQETNYSRDTITPASVLDLAKDIKLHGQLAAVIVTTVDDEIRAAQDVPEKYNYILRAGYRRFMAISVVLRAAKILATVRDDIHSEIDAIIINISENVQRKELNILEESHAIERLLKLGCTEEQMMERLGQKRGWIQVRSMLMKIPAPDIHEMAAAGSISQTEVRDLFRIWHLTGDIAQVYEAARKIKDARALGKTPPTTKPKSANTKRLRKKNEIIQLQDHLRSQFRGNNILTRLCAWAIGEITDGDLHTSLIEYDEAFFCYGYNPPDEIRLS